MNWCDFYFISVLQILS